MNLEELKISSSDMTGLGLEFLSGSIINLYKLKSLLINCPKGGSGIGTLGKPYCT